MMVFILKYLQCGLRYGKRKKAIFGGSAANVKTIEFVPRKKTAPRNGLPRTTSPCFIHTCYTDLPGGK